MVRISDILKQRGQFPEPEPPRKKKEEESSKIQDNASEGAHMSKAMAGGESEAEKEMEVVKTMHQMQLDSEESARIYQRALEIIKDILEKGQSQDTPLDLKEAYEIVKTMVDRLVLGDRELIALTVGSSENNYLYAHLVNVCILSIDMGLGLGYNKSKLNELGLGAFLHDLGMIKVMDIAKQPRKLTEGELEEVKKHPIYGSDMLSRMENIQEGIIYIIKEEHERINGTGYPEGLKDEQIHEYAKIVAIIDVYEALVHHRSHRRALFHHEAIKELLRMNTDKSFEPKMLKLLINRIGLYPVGCWVKLNTGEIGKVISANEDSPLRPKVNIIFSPQKEKLPQIKLIDLSRHTNVYIERRINPQESDLKFE